MFFKAINFLMVGKELTAAKEVDNEKVERLH